MAIPTILEGITHLCFSEIEQICKLEQKNDNMI